MEQTDAVVAKKAGASDIARFYYKKASCASKRSSLSLDSVLVGLLLAKFGGSDQRLRKWVSAQARIAQDNGLDTTKSVSRAVQENAIRIIADPVLVQMLSPEEVAENEKQCMLAPWLGQGPNKSAASQPKRL
jgi:hypothetical protein